MVEYNWRESVEFQINRIERHFRADIAEAINRCGGAVSSKEWVWIEERVDAFLESVDAVRAGAQQRKQAASLPAQEFTRRTA